MVKPTVLNCWLPRETFRFEQVGQSRRLNQRGRDGSQNVNSDVAVYWWELGMGLTEASMSDSRCAKRLDEFAKVHSTVTP